MARVLAIDYGTKRIGLAVTDPMQMIANGLDTVHANEVIAYLKDYLSKEKVERFIVGLPKRMNLEASASEKSIQPFIRQLEKNFPDVPVSRVDERFTSKIAMQSMIDGGLSKKGRQDKKLVDKISATLILQSYLEQKDFGIQFPSNQSD